MENQEKSNSLVNLLCGAVTGSPASVGSVVCIYTSCDGGPHPAQPNGVQQKHWVGERSTSI